LSSTTAMDSVRPKYDSETLSASPSGGTATSPRAYAAAIIALPTRAERAALLEQVPEHLRGLVERHVRNHFARRASDKRGAGSAD